MSLGRRIKTLRKSLSLTQADLAAKVGVSRIYIQALETGRRMPSMKLLSKLAPALGSEIPWMVQDMNSSSTSRMQLEDMMASEEVEVWYRNHKLTPSEIRMVYRIIEATLEECRRTEEAAEDETDVS